MFVRWVEGSRAGEVIVKKAAVTQRKGLVASPGPIRNTV